MPRKYSIFLFLFFQAGIFLCTVITFFHIEDQLLHVLILILCLLAIGCITLIYLTAKHYQDHIYSENEVLYLEHQISLQQTYLNNIRLTEKSIDMYKKQMEDDLLSIYGHIATNEIYKIENQYNQLKSIYHQLHIINYCDNPTINAILYPKCQYCLANHISFEISLSNTSHLHLSDVALVCIFSNLMDNAIDVLKKLDAKSKSFIFLSTTYSTNYYFIHFQNAKPPKLLVTMEQTTRNEAKEHGHGLQIIENISKKYDGTFMIQNKGSSVIFDIALRTKSFK